MECVNHYLSLIDEKTKDYGSVIGGISDSRVHEVFGEEDEYAPLLSCVVYA